MAKLEGYDITDHTKITFDCEIEICGKEFVDKVFIEPELASSVIKRDENENMVYIAFSTENKIILGKDKEENLCLESYDDYNDFFDQAIDRHCDLTYLPFEGGYLIRDSRLRCVGDLGASSVEDSVLAEELDEKPEGEGPTVEYLATQPSRFEVDRKD